MLTYQYLAEQLQAQSFDTLLTHFLTLAPSSQGLKPYAFRSRPDLETGRYEGQQGAKECLEECQESLNVAAERVFFRKQPKLTLEQLREFVKADVPSTVVAAHDVIKELAMEFKNIYLDESRSVRGINQTKFFTDHIRHPEHLVLNTGSIFAVRDSEKQLHFIDPVVVLSGAEGEVLERVVYLPS